MRRLSLVLLILAAVSLSPAQRADTSASPVFKRFRPLILYAPYDGVGQQLWQGFQLIQKSNAGDPLAQHELGIRYFTGQGFPRDTAKAVYWIRKAADQELPIAQYNYGVFLTNGWGVDWNPFEGFRYIRMAAAQDMTEAVFLLGLTYTDNMVVRRDMKKAYQFVKTAADRNYAPAKDVLAEMERRGFAPGHEQDGTQEAAGDTSSRQAIANRYQPVFLDFGESGAAAPSDEASALPDSLIRNNAQFRRALGMSVIADSSKDTLRGLPLVRRAADAGSPEALALLGRWYETGTYVRKDMLAAAEYYLRAFSLDSPRAPAALAELLKAKDFFSVLKSRVERNDPPAQYVWAALVSSKFDYQITEPQALKLLQRSARERHVPALIELGFCFYRGKWIARDTAQALACWQQAADLGSREARLRILAYQILNRKRSDAAAIGELKRGEDDGSVLSQLALAYCYQNGLGVPLNIAEAVRLYRACAQRGNQNGYEELRHLYDALRPPQKEFHIAD